MCTPMRLLELSTCLPSKSKSLRPALLFAWHLTLCGCHQDRPSRSRLVSKTAILCERRPLKLQQMPSCLWCVDRGMIAALSCLRQLTVGKPWHGNMAAACLTSCHGSPPVRSQRSICPIGTPTRQHNTLHGCSRPEDALRAA